MKYFDKVYGESEIVEPVILELMESRALKRLKGVEAAGYIKPYLSGFQEPYNRFDHSVGVYLLLKKFNAPIEERVSGLIHDVSHSAFSHCVDYALDSGNGAEQDHQDSVHSTFVRSTDIPDIIFRYGFDLEYLLDDKHFPLKENQLPDICADRIDYSLRTAVAYKEMTSKAAARLIGRLQVRGGEWIFSDLQSAQRFADIFFQLNTKYYTGLTSAAMFAGVGNYVAHALEKKYINLSDLYHTDQEVLLKISKNHPNDPELAKLFRRMSNRVKYKNDPLDYQRQIWIKSRAVDPKFLDANKIKRLSAVDPDWAAVVERELKPKQYFLKYED